MKNYWDKGIDYPTYIEDTKQRIAKLQNSEEEEDKTYLHYYDLGLTRMQRVDKTYTPDAEFLIKLKEKNFKGKFLIIAEGWCGDAAMIVPVIVHFFEGHNEVKIVYRDENDDLINQFLTNGGKAIPIVIILDENDNVITSWGPRPKQGLELLKKYKADPENYTVDMLHNDLIVYYTKNKGYDIIQELLEKI